MSEDPKVPAAPAAPREVHAPLTSFVRGGTLSSRAEHDLAQKKADAEKRRAGQDAQYQQAQQNPGHARMSTIADLGGTKNHAAIVLEIRNSDNVAEDFIVCELTAGRGDDPTELILCMVCPACAKRVGSAEAQFKFSNKHRKFELDTRRQGELWVNPTLVTEFVHLAGTIQLLEVVTCPLNCGWRFKIDSSVIRTL